MEATNQDAQDLRRAYTHFQFLVPSFEGGDQVLSIGVLRQKIGNAIHSLINEIDKGQSELNAYHVKLLTPETYDTGSIKELNFAVEKLEKELRGYIAME
ncbi:hypothetical protein [Paracoccus nototheniae]|uniref:Uncharacterized protein n=1 Tax=Paracoccus nototheniae TaxID=2489002 RepID=A0ABW4E0T5_9RHOB|nr:hypothetical protein [Paracoccus nototheniae]